ncbi:MAG: tetratricopeptide repeat protein [Okeania sp.]|nr:tetratricopeptide repeat protein [Okeania sp.]
MSAGQLLKQANKLKRQGRLDEAIANYRNAIKLNPNSFILHQNLGDALVKKGLLDEATLELKKALELKPDSVVSQAYLGEVLVKQKLFDEAINYLERAVKIQPDFHKYYNSLGLALIGKEKYDEAIDFFQKAIELKPDSCWGYYNLSQVLSKQDKLSVAREYYEKAIALNPQLPSQNQKASHIISPLKDSPEMEFTGERYVPNIQGQISYEHLHRYGLCLEIVRGKSVLDIASGEGYGSAMLSQTASSVVGVDIDISSIEFAKKKYQDKSNLKFLVGGCDSIPLPSESIDIVVSFETIEHHDKHEEMMTEIKRVLKNDGVLIISSPNRFVYSDLPNYCNPFHIKELYQEEFTELLNKYFSHTKIYGQRMAISSFLYSLDESNLKNLNCYSGDSQLISKQFLPLYEPVYFIAICSNNFNNIKDIFLDSFYLDRNDDLLNPDSLLHNKRLSIYNIGNELNLAKGGNAKPYLVSGWSYPEEWGCWALRPQAKLSLSLKNQVERKLTLSINAKAKLPDNNTETVINVKLNDKKLGELLFSGNDFLTKKLKLPLDLISGETKFNFVFDMPDYSSQSSENIDQRPLALAVRSILIS